MLVVPLGVIGAVLAAMLTGLNNDIYLQVSLITTIGVSAKNAILIVEFAEERVQSGMNAFDAAMEAARLRLRPILMTSLAFVRSEEHTSELQSLMRISYAVFCLKNKTTTNT